MKQKRTAVESYWHALQADEVLKLVRSSAHGLSGEEAQKRLEQFGPNRLSPPKKRGPLLRFAIQFFLWDMIHDVAIEYGRTVAVNTLVMFEVFYLLNTRYLIDSVLTKEGLTGNRFIYIAILIVMIAQLIFTYVPFMQRLFGSSSIPFMEWILMTGVTSLVFFLVELEKYVYRQFIS